MVVKLASKDCRIEDWHGLRGSALYFSLAESAQRTVFITGHAADLEDRAHGLRSFWPKARVLLLPPIDGSPFAFPPAHLSTRRARLQCIDALLADEWDVIITTPNALIQPTAPKAKLAEPRLQLRTGANYDLVAITRTLAEMGYLAADMVGQPGDFSRRGGILDIFSFSDTHAFRLEFFDDELEEIRVFDPSTQRSISHCESALILPLYEWVIGAEETTTFHRRGGALWNHSDARGQFLGLVAELRDRGLFSGYLHWSSLFFDEPMHIGDLLAGDAQVVFDDWEECCQSLERVLDQMALQLEARGEEQLRASAQQLYGLEDPTALPVGDSVSVVRCHPLKLDRVDREFATQTVPHYQNDVRRFLQHWEPQAKRQAVILVCRSTGVCARLEELLDDDGHLASRIEFPLKTIPAPGFFLATGYLDTGFSWPERNLTIFSERDIFSKISKPSVARQGKNLFQTEFRDLKIGDYVVHQEQGIGKFLGLIEMEVGGGLHEMMALEYRGHQKLYVSLNQLNLVQRHSGADSQIQLDKMGGVTWNKTKTRIKKAVRNMARELLDLYAARDLVTGHVYAVDTDWQREFEESFEFEPTDGQLRAVADIKGDLESTKPMDRLLVGDVGFGKTEVAMRLAFKAVMEGFQVAILCPTTVLAFQHFHTFRNRFAAFPVTIRWLSRFTSPAKAREAIKGTANGEVDILIGTHRILGKDLQFKRLGAVVIDEEQRFGVSHKERLKHLRKQVDVLSMSATPIPRTLNMSLTGIRDISIIETPPRNRLAISTTVAEAREGLIRSAIEFELERGGQVFFIHNRVETMDTVIANLKGLVPSADFGMVHGQMEAKRIERVMMAFMKGETDVLVASTIIENGVDIPNANTMIVNRADRFGMSQLYQLRGRIGRSDRPAYAYLLVPPRARMSTLARKRLAALEEFSELGSGFRVAAMDMELRGAGNLLGGQQAGHIHTIGYDMYIKLLEEAVHELKGTPIEDPIHCVLNLHFGSAIPRNYIGDTNQRLSYYKRIAGATQKEEIGEIRETLEDCYGPLPTVTDNLCKENELRLFLAGLKVIGVDREQDKLRFRFHGQAEVNAEVVLGWIEAGKSVALHPDGMLTVPLDVRQPEPAYGRIREIAQILLA